MVTWSPVTEKWFADLVQGTFQGWVKYTDVLEDGLQRKVVHIIHDANTEGDECDNADTKVYDVLVGDYFGDVEKRYKVTVSVEEIA